MANAKFDSLATGYDLYQSCYPRVLIEDIRRFLPTKDACTVADIGAGTGIALEGLIPALGNDHSYYAVGISSDMIAHSRAKFPAVRWCLGKAEDVVPNLPVLDLILAAQSFQWMDRQPLAAALPKLSSQGIFALLQNNCDFSHNTFLDEYETLLEAMNPDYNRYYRHFNFQTDLAAAFSCACHAIAFKQHCWHTWLPVRVFVGMSQSSGSAGNERRRLSLSEATRQPVGQLSARGQSGVAL